MPMTTTKKDLAIEISDKLGVKKQLAYEVVDTLFKAMRESLISGDRIEIRGFGVLGVKNTKPKPAARNPRTGEIVYVPARKKSYFKAGVLIKKALHEPLSKREDRQQEPESTRQPAAEGIDPYRQREAAPPGQAVPSSPAQPQAPHQGGGTDNQ
jgi:nucleoid DNA-binding protein